MLVVEGTNAPMKSKEFRKVAYHLYNDPKGTQGTLVQYLGKDVTYKIHTYIQ